MHEDVKNAEKSIIEKPKILPEGTKLEIAEKPKIVERDKLGRIKPTGRPKKKPKLTWDDFQKDALCQMIDNIIKDTINTSLLRDRAKQLERTQVGSALMYSIYYYTKFRPDHPLMIVGIATAQTASSVMSCMKSPKKTPTGTGARPNV